MRVIDLIKMAILVAVMAILASCNSSSSLGDGLESAAPPSAEIPQQPANPPATAEITNGSEPVTSPDGQIAALPTTRPVAFLPVSNAPQTAISSLTSSIRNSAANNQVTIVASVQDGAEYQIKGYFSALEDGSGTLLVYVWDVLDRNNKRVYRISGQEQSSGKSSDPWASVTPQMIDRVAVSTLSQLKSWLTSRG